MPALAQPPKPSFPYFVYGLLMPGQLAFSQVEPFVARREKAATRGTLRLRDGIPLLDCEAGPGMMVSGWLLWFDAARRDQAWLAVRSFEPAAQYRWRTVKATYGGGKTDANVLEGKRPKVGTDAETRQEWSARSDPTLKEGLEEVRRLVEEAAPGGVAAQPDTDDLWHSFFRLQAAYLLLWSIVERYTALRFGPALDPMQRVKRLGAEASFRAAVTDAGAEPGQVIDSRAPSSRPHRLDLDGTEAAEYYYQIRSNLSHRGKSAFRDAQLVHKAVTELERTMTILLDTQLPTEESGA